MVSLMAILFSTECFLFVYMYIDLLKLKAYKLFENSDADLSWPLFFKEANLFSISDYFCKGNPLNATNLSAEINLFYPLQLNTAF